MNKDLISKSVDIWRTPDCVGFIKGRVALYALLRAMGIGTGDDVLVPGFTCVIVPAAIQYTGAKPVYYDIDPITLQGDPDLALNAITKNTRVILIQHNFGTPAPTGNLLEVCRKKGILVIEDCAHAMGASVNGKPVGLLGDAAFCSLQWSKPTTTGLGGIARTNQPDLADQLKKIVETEFSEPAAIKSIYLGLLSAVFRAWYRPTWYWAVQSAYRWAGQRGIIQGSSSNQELESASMPESYCETFGSLRAGSLKSSLKNLPGILTHRRQIYDLYRGLFSTTLMWSPPATVKNECGAALRYPILVENRTELLNAACKTRVELGDWFNAPLHPLGCNPEVFGYRDGMCPIAEAASKRVINLPTHSRVTHQEARRIVDFVLNNGELSQGTGWSTQG